MFVGRRYWCSVCEINHGLDEVCLVSRVRWTRPAECSGNSGDFVNIRVWKDDAAEEKRLAAKGRIVPR